MANDKQEVSTNIQQEYTITAQFRNLLLDLLAVKKK